MPLDLTSLAKGVAALQRALGTQADPDALEALSEDQRETLRAGVVQTFEFTYELCWRFMRRWLAANLAPHEVEGVSRRELFRMAAQQGLIRDVDSWMAYHEGRNITSHTYSRATADRVIGIARDFEADAVSLLGVLEAHNA
jgi:nucleotidyltransferase substrate binding protein (TIGR01987 family)